MKTLVAFLCLFVPALCFCQTGDLIRSVNYAIGPEYVLNMDSVPSFHIFNLCTEAKLIAGDPSYVVVEASNADSSAELNKIFILERDVNDNLEIIDSSAAFDIGFLGPHIDVKGNTLTVTHNFDKGSAIAIYHFNSAQRRFMLVKLRYNVSEQNYPDYDHSVNLNQEYDVESHQLTLKSWLYNYNSGKADKQKTKALTVTPQEKFSLRLDKMKDPYDYDVFLTEGKVYNQMMKY
jgi:hypothetical protein